MSGSGSRKPCVCVQPGRITSGHGDAPKTETTRRRRVRKNTHVSTSFRQTPTRHYTNTNSNSTVTFYPQNVTDSNILRVLVVASRV